MQGPMASKSLRASWEAPWPARADAGPGAGFRLPAFHAVGTVVGFSGDQSPAFTEQPFLCKPESLCLGDSVWRTQPWAGALPKQGWAGLARYQAPRPGRPSV